MPFPRVEHCIVCEDARPELAGKSTILGFYGLLPNVQLVVQDLKRPIDRLTFMLICEGSSAGKFMVRPQLLNAAGQAAVMEAIPKDMEVSLPGSAKRQLLVFTLSPLQFQGTGKYAFSLIVDSKEVYRDYFEVIQGTVVASLS